jgi:DNA-binding LacI/PurR family transcriptional regulator
MTRHHRHATLKDYLVERIRRGIVAGEFAAGERLPPERWWSQELTVSRVTVRRALTELREQGVLTAARGSGWRVKGTGGETRNRILVVFSVSAPMAMEFYEGVQQGLAGSRWRPTLTSINLLRAWPIADFADLGTVAGIVVALGARLPTRIRRELRATGLPWVQAFHAAADQDAPCVTTDHAASVRTMLDHLAGQGHRRFAYLTHEMADDPSFRQRASAFQSHVRHRDLAGQFIDIRKEDWFNPATGDMVLSRVRGPDGTWPDAVLCSTLMWAEELILNLTRNGVRVPQEVSVAAFGSYGEFRHILPSAGLTAITRAAFPLAGLGRTSADVLLARLAGKEAAPVTRLAPELVVGDSTRPREGAGTLNAQRSTCNAKC